jgi:hypothetical protein
MRSGGNLNRKIDFSHNHCLDISIFNSYRNNNANVALKTYNNSPSRM